MNKGLLRGFTKHPRKNKPWVYYPIVNPTTHKTTYVSPSGLDGFSITADATVVTTGRVDGQANIPVDGSVRAFRVVVIGRNTTAQSSHYIYAYSWDTVSDSANGPYIPCYYGKFAGDYSSNMGMVLTGGLGNTQFKYSVAWTSGTGTGYIRIVGYYREED